MPSEVSTPAAQLDCALQGRARDVQAKLLDKLTRGEVRELAHAIDDVVLHELEVMGNVIRAYRAQQIERRGGPRHG